MSPLSEILSKEDIGLILSLDYRTLSSFTFDFSKENKELAKSAIEGIELTRFGGTDLYEAVSISENILEDEEDKAIILLSDGQINIGNIPDVVEFANNNEVLVHTLGIGSIEGGQASFGISKLDQESLQSLAYNTRGEYFEINSLEVMKQSFNEIVPLTTKLGGIDLSLFLILLTIIVFILQQFLVNFVKISI